jgi:nitrite reductase/ring-hydroxylating ferredoxin subunit
MTSETAWIPVAASHLLGPGKVMAVTVDEVDLAVWREASGAAHAWIDRCPHRGMRLSLGAVAGDTLICPYHGWRFDAAGQCVQMPAHPTTAPPRAAHTRPVASREEGGFVWARLAGEPSAQAIPSDRIADRTPAPTPVRTLTIAGAASRVAAALMIHPLGEPAATPWTGWQWTEPGGRLQVRAVRDADRYIATLDSDGAIDVEHVVGEKIVRYRFLMHPAQSGHMTVHLTSTIDAADTHTAQAMNAQLSAVRRWMAVNPDDAAWALAASHVSAFTMTQKESP